MAKLEGTIAVDRPATAPRADRQPVLLPGRSADAPAPYGGDPPAEAVTDSHEVAKQVDLYTESSRPEYDLPFAVERPAGFYYLQVRAILFRSRRARCSPRPSSSSSPGGRCRSTSNRLAGSRCRWSGRRIPLEELGSYGVVEPRGERHAEPGGADRRRPRSWSLGVYGDERGREYFQKDSPPLFVLVPDPFPFSSAGISRVTVDR